MGLTEHLERIVEGMPDEAAVTLPVKWLRRLLKLEGQSSVELDDLTCEQAARSLGRSPSTLREWCRAGEIPSAYRLRGREWRIPRSGLRAFLDGQGDHLPRKAPRRPQGLGLWRGYVGRGR